jgi:hypothetical protein
MQLAAAKSIANIDRRALVCTDHDERYCMNMIVASLWVWPTRQLAMITVMMEVMITMMEMGGDSVHSLFIGGLTQ